MKYGVKLRPIKANSYTHEGILGFEFYSTDARKEFLNALLGTMDIVNIKTNGIVYHKQEYTISMYSRKGQEYTCADCAQEPLKEKDEVDYPEYSYSDKNIKFNKKYVCKTCLKRQVDYLSQAHPECKDDLYPKFTEIWEKKRAENK